jgi:hypothetical protein
MAACQNCKSQLSCGCQKRKASNGTQVCANCLASYEAKLKTAQPNEETLKKFTK